MRLKAIFAALSIIAAIPVFSQVVPAATEGGWPIKVGAGFSAFNGDWGSGRMVGGALWIDYSPTQMPAILHGWGLEVEARDIRNGQSADYFRNIQALRQEGTFRQDTVGGGPIFTWLHFRNLHPYAKFVADFAGQDFNIDAPHYHHETQAAFAPGIGLEYRAFRNLWVRADYEYQIWPDQFNNHDWILDPQGITVGLSCDFRHLHRH